MCLIFNSPSNCPHKGMGLPPKNVINMIPSTALRNGPLISCKQFMGDFVKASKFVVDIFTCGTADICRLSQTYIGSIFIMFMIACTQMYEMYSMRLDHGI